MKTKINKANKKQDAGSNLRNGVFWGIFVVFLVVAGIACWWLYAAVTGGLDFLGIGDSVGSAELVKLKEATEKSVKSNDDIIAKGREEQKTAIPDSDASAEFDHLVFSSNMIVIDKDYDSIKSKDECAKQYDRLKKLDDYTAKMTSVVTRMGDEKRSKPLADAKSTLSGIRDQITSFASGLSEDSLPSDKKNLKSDLNNLLGKVDTTLQSGNIDQVNELANKLNSMKKTIQDAQAEKSASDSRTQSAQVEQDALNKTYSSFKEKVQALQNVPSIRSKGLKAVCEMAGGVYSGSDAQGECSEK